MFTAIPNTIEYAKRPYSLLSLTNGKGRVSACSRSVLGAIYKEQAFKGNCKKTYNELMTEVNVSRATTSRSLKALYDSNIIYKKGTSSYSVVLDKSLKSRGYIITPDFFYTSKVKFCDGSERFLTKPEIDVLSFILSYSIKQTDEFDGDSDGKGYVGSVSNIGRLVCLSTTTVKKVIDSLLHADLIFSNDTNESRNGVRFSRYVANSLFVKKVRSQMRKNKGLTDNVTIDMEAERQRFYAKRTDKHNKEVKDKQHKLNQIPEYGKAELESRKNEKDIAQAEIDKDFNLVDRLIEHKRQLAELKRKIALTKFSADIIDENGDIHIDPPWKCCDEQGYKADGRPCDCWKKATLAI